MLTIAHRLQRESISSGRHSSRISAVFSSPIRASSESRSQHAASSSSIVSRPESVDEDEEEDGVWPSVTSGGVLVGCACSNSSLTRNESIVVSEGSQALYIASAATAMNGDSVRRRGGDAPDDDEAAGAAPVPAEECNLDALFERFFGDGGADAIRFEPMLPRVYELTLPSIDSRLNFINVGRRHAAFLRHVYGGCDRCEHAAVLNEKMKLFTAVITKLLDVNGILERRETTD
ncbi:M51 protein [Murid betaherpesvirus 1]|uniref:M51 n=4 Tax=Murid herpesvirus 1 TaxID=10366 RepID=B3UX07_MUHV1|nr:M51 [Muromegalovirus G4]ACE95401.1 M51 [Muromegalovirus WP15B]ACE95565.1 M51 [Muromegalovirus C4A]AWV68483.1 M51 protein [Murid betaherpesvirus 1]AWV68659.1 M51 protein [Murid betaherpesvirus 1]